MSWSKAMRVQLAVVLLAFGGCAGASGGSMDDGAGSGGNNTFGNAGMGSSAMQGNSAAPATSTGSGGHAAVSSGSGGSGSKPAMHAGSGGSAAAGSGGTTAQSGSGGQGSGGTPGTGSGGTNAGSAGMSGNDDDPFGLADAGLFDPDPNAPPPAAGQCADAVCFDIFDCTLWHADLVGVCDFTDCVDFVCVVN